MYIMQPYDDALKFILENGERKPNRTGVDCLTVFSITSRYRIDKCFPLITGRKLSSRSVFAELVWMLSGSTNNDDLVKLGCKYWTPWVDPADPKNQEFYRQTGFPVGYLGPIYGWQMRHFGGDYRGFLRYGFGGHSPATDRGFDQIAWLNKEIRVNPDSRRLLVSMWNPKDMHLQRLPPCHYNFRVYIDGKGRMSLLLNQRSCDFPVGVPANIQFYSVLCWMLAKQHGYMPYEFIHNTEDAHIYVSQIEQVKEYLSRKKPDSPTLKLKKESGESILSYSPDDFEIVDYEPLPAIKIPVEV